MNDIRPKLRLIRLGIDTYKEVVIYMRRECPVCLSEGFEVKARVRVQLEERSIVATIHFIHSDILEQDSVSLSEYAWNILEANEGDEVTVVHATPVRSLSDVRSKIYGNELSAIQFDKIIHDISSGRYSDIDITSFITACAGGRMTYPEIVALTQSMIKVGDVLSWHSKIIVDKHCVGGLPGNRTTPIVVAIVAEFGLTMPKTSSRAITSPAGTADTMEVLAPVEMDIQTIKKIVGEQNGCIVWGGNISLSPADDVLIRIEKALDIDSEGQLVASILSKKIAAGSTHVLIDIPVGFTTKVRSVESGIELKNKLEQIGQQLGITVKAIISDGEQPVGRGIGPALEARDILAVLQDQAGAPADLRERALVIAGHILEFSPQVQVGEGYATAEAILQSGKAWRKFQGICDAQGGLREIPQANFQYTVSADSSGIVREIDNRAIALVAKLAGAPQDKAAGIDLHISMGSAVIEGDDLFTIYADSKGELEYALKYLNEEIQVVKIVEPS